MSQLSKLILTGGARTDQALVNFPEFTNLKQLEIYRVGISNLNFVSKCPNIESLNVGDTLISDLRPLESLVNLTQLGVWSTKITDDQLVHFKPLTKLSDVSLWETAITDAGLKHLEGLSNLKKLELKKSQVTPAGFTRLQSVLPNCKISFDPTQVAQPTVTQPSAPSSVATPTPIPAPSAPKKVAQDCWSWSFRPRSRRCAEWHTPRSIRNSGSRRSDRRDCFAEALEVHANPQRAGDRLAEDRRARRVHVQGHKF